ncbi:MAG: imidazole glycerol phosphate synthase subunit HisH [Candidatus Bathyarchaeia archaeon]
MNKPEVAILDYGVGNLMSVTKGLSISGAKPKITANVKEALSMDAIVLPGVGAYFPAMKHLTPHIEDFKTIAEKGKVIFGICLGLQLFFSESCEGGTVKGLGLVEGKVMKLPMGVKIPQIGWNNIRIIQSSHPILDGIKDGEYFYFAHSYYGAPNCPGLILASTDYGTTFPSIIVKDNVIGTQFHPEKSGCAGLRLLRNLVDLIRSRG